MPLFTLQSVPHGPDCKTRGQDGLLFLSCRTLSFPATCRFIPAHGLSPKFYRWSSALAHCRGQDDLEWSPTALPEIADWQAWLTCSNDPETNEFIRECTFTGRPCGDEAFVKQMELDSRRDFTRKKPGPKPKAHTEGNLLLDWSQDRIVR
jgi:hypothetical protein